MGRNSSKSLSLILREGGTSERFFKKREVERDGTGTGEGCDRIAAAQKSQVAPSNR